MADTRAFKVCRCDGDCRCVPEDKATASAAEFLRERYGAQRCDHEAVSDCVRCNVLYLVGVAERAVEGRLRYV